MTLRIKSLVLITLASIVLLAVIFTATNTVFTDGMTKIEAQTVTRHVERAQEALNAEIEFLSMKSADWAVWDDTYHFIQDRNPEYEKKNLSNLTLENLQIDFLGIFNLSGEPLASVTYDIDTQQPGSLPDAFFDFLRINNLLAHPSETAIHKGIIFGFKDPLLYVSRPTIQSSGEGPINGSIVFARRLSPSVITRLSEKTRLDLSVIDLSNSSSHPDVIKAVKQLSSQNQIHLSATSDEQISAYTFLTDITKKRSGVLRITTNRPVYSVAKEAEKYSRKALVVIGFGYAGLMVMLVEYLVLTPIRRLNRAVSELGSSGKLSARLPDTFSRDELGHLSRNLNEMLGQLEHAQEHINEERGKAELYLNISPVIMLVLDTRDTILKINRFGAQRLGYEESDLIGKNWIDTCVPEDMREKTRTLLEQGIQKQSLMDIYEHDVLQKNGARRTIRWHSTLIEDAHGVITGFLSSGEDITELKKTQDDMARHTRELELLNNSLIGRELKMADLKKENQQLRSELASYKEKSS